MKNIHLIGFLLMTLTSNAQEKALEGFAYAETVAPTGKEWEAPGQVALDVVNEVLDSLRLE